MRREVTELSLFDLEESFEPDGENPSWYLREAGTVHDSRLTQAHTVSGYQTIQ